MKKIIIILITAVFMAATGNSYAAFNQDSIGTTSAQFLKLGVGARPIAMGEAYTGVSDDINAIYWNPAGLNLTAKKEIGAMHAIWFQDISFSWLAYSQKAFGGTVGGAVNYLGAGEMDQYDSDGRDLEATYTAYDMMVTLAYARSIKNWPVGINVKLINSCIEEETAFGAAADIGVLKTISEARDIKVGLVVQNLGMGLKYVEETDPLPINIKIGSYYKLFSKKLLVAADVNFPADNQINFHAGAEYRQKIGAVTVMPRAGFKTTTITDLDTMSGLSGGIGFAFKGLCVDYAWVPYWELGDTHRISLSYKFGQSEEVAVKSKVANPPKNVKKKKASKKSESKITEDEKLYQDGLKQLEKGNNLKAIEIFTQVLTVNPNHKGALKSLEEANKKLK